MMDVDDPLIPDGIPGDAPAAPDEDGILVPDVADAEPMESVGGLGEPEDLPEDPDTPAHNSSGR